MLLSLQISVTMFFIYSIPFPLFSKSVLSYISLLTSFFICCLACDFPFSCYLFSSVLSLIAFFYLNHLILFDFIILSFFSLFYSRFHFLTVTNYRLTHILVGLPVCPHFVFFFNYSRPTSSCCLYFLTHICFPYLLRYGRSPVMSFIT